MHIESLRFFYEVAKVKSISTIAKSSHISQSALSQQLLKLEDSFNTKLFIRSNKGVTLTPEGEIVFKHCETILNSYEKMLQEVETSSLRERSITIDGLDILLSTLVSSSLAISKKNYDNLNINILSSEVNANNIIHNISDMNISYINYQDIPTIITKELCNDTIVFIADNSFPKDSLTLDEFLSIPLVLPNDNLHFPEILNLHIENIMKEPAKLNVSLNVSSFESAIISILHLKALTAIPLSVYNLMYKHSTFKIVKVDNLDFNFSVYLNVQEQVYKKEKKFINKFISTLKGFL